MDTAISISSVVFATSCDTHNVELSTLPGVLNSNGPGNPAALPAPTSDFQSPLEFTVISAIEPKFLTKSIGISANGEMRKQSSAHLSRGVAKLFTVADLQELRALLDKLESSQAVTWGVTGRDKVDICTVANQDAQAHGAVPRTRENFRFPTGPGVMMIDHDGVPGQSLTSSQLISRIIGAAPVLKAASILVRPSASAGCFHPNGRELSGLDRHRLYIPVTNASLVPKAGKALELLLWANEGSGWCEVGAAGQLLERTLVDGAVWQPERLDFVGPPVLLDGVTRGDTAGVIFGDPTQRFDLNELILSATDTIACKAKSNKKAARAEVSSAADEERARWVLDRAEKMASRRGISVEVAEQVLSSASKRQVLMGDFELTCADGKIVSVTQILSEPNLWNGKRFADPLDPDHDHRVALACLVGQSKKTLYSHRHGGIIYELQSNKAEAHPAPNPGKAQDSEGDTNLAPVSSPPRKLGRSPIFPLAVERPCYVVLDEAVQHGSSCLRNGVYRCDVVRLEEGQQLTETWFCSPLYLKAVTFDTHRNNFGRLLRFKPTIGEWREWAMPMELLASDGAQLRCELLNMGVELEPFIGRRELQTYLQTERPKRHVLCSLQTGWCGQNFVLPEMVFGPDSNDVAFQSGARLHVEYALGGSLEGWRKGVSRKAQGNPILMLAISASFTGALLNLCNAEGGGVHLVGDSSSGKSTAARAACSTWGGEQYMRSWKSTDSGMEGVAALFNDGLLVLDEISECDSKNIGPITYALTNGRGKQRATRTGAARSITTWRCFVLSSGERTIASSMDEGGYKAKAGQAVRLLDLVVQRQFGAWDCLHEEKSGQAFSDALKVAALEHYGHAGRAFLQKLTSDKSDFMKMFEIAKRSTLFATDGNEGQEKRAAARMALIGMAGELATAYGITEWPVGAATDAAALGFKLWREARGSGNDERRQILRIILGFIETHGDSRFSDIKVSEQSSVRDRAGWWRATKDGREYLFTASALNEAIRGFDLKRALDVLQEARALPPPGANRERSTYIRVAGRGTKLYVINPDFLVERGLGA